MACPLFIPSSPLGELVTIAAPLGDLYGGRCAADPAAEIEPETARRFCNFGYARGHCQRAALSEADAVRLLVRADDGRTVEVAWSTERNHHPVAVGVERVELNAGDPSDVPLKAQVQACAAAYARKTQARPAFVGQTVVAAHP